jgi:hypothetical protein
MNFAVDVGKWAQQTRTNVEDLRKATILGLFSSVIKDTPVGNDSDWKHPAPPGYVGGRLRGNWQISNGAPKSGTLEVTDPNGGTTIAKVQDHVANLSEREEAVFLTNNLPYAYRVEYEGWSHTKAPEGMVRKNFVLVTQNLKAQTR